MSDARPIPTDTFADAVDRLDESELASFVAALRAARDGAIGVDAAPPGEEADDSEQPRAAPPPADLRDELLYALEPEAADDLCREFIGVPARSPSYAPENETAAGSGDPTDGVGQGEDGPAEPSSRTESPPATRPSQSSTAATPADGHRRASRSADRTDDSPAGSENLGPWATAALAVALLVAVGGAASLAGLSAGDAASALSGLREEGRAGTSDVGASPATATPDSPTRPGTGAETPDDPASVTPSGGARKATAPGLAPGRDAADERNLRPEPTCERSFLLVTQIQMNALRYNDAETNAGIRTVRRFASPTNRRAVDSFAEYVEVIRSPTYAAMLSADSVQYEPTRVGNATAQVRVVTRENGTVTGRYDFFLRKVGDGPHEGCWMTDAVLTQSMMVLDVGVGK